MRTIIKNETNWNMVIEECAEYITSAIINGDSNDTIKGYIDDIHNTRENGWSIVNTGVFHDAIGKVVYNDNKCVKVITDY